MADEPIMDMLDIGQAIAWQASHAERAGAPITARVIRAQLAILETGSKLAERIRHWPGLSLEDALPLRVAGGLHWLHLAARAPELAPIYAGDLDAQREVDARVSQVAREHEAELLPWLDSPPQTNEAGRSASIMAGLLWLAPRLGPRFELNEIGASAGVNTMMERYRYDLGGVCVGPADSPMQLRPQWRGSAPPAAGIEIASIRGCDVAPVDLADAAEALRLKAYVWTDAPERLARIDAATGLAAQHAPDLVAADAGDWVEAVLTEPQAPGVTRVLYHSVMWQYLPPATRTRITAAMQASGARATPERPLTWLALETNRVTFRHELTVRYWPGGTAPVIPSEAHPHGAWIDWHPPE